MDATSSSLNAKQRRKLLRQQQHAQETIKQEQEEVEVKQEPSALVDVVQGEPNDQLQQLNTKERRRLARLAKQKTEVVTQGDGPTDVPPTVVTATSTATSEATSEATSSTDKSQLNAQERRLLKRQAKRKAEGVEEYKPPTKKQKKKKTQGEDGDGDHKSIHLTLFVGQLPYRATEAMVRKHFEEAGEIKLRMLTDKKTKRFKGTAFIEVKDSKALGAALSRHHTLLQGRRINVEMTASGGGNKSENRRNKIDLLRKKQSNVQVEKTKALIQKHIDGPEYKLKQEDVDDRMIDFLSWFDYETAKKALDEYNRCVSDRVNNRKAFFMGILKRFRQTDGVE